MGVCHSAVLHGCSAGSFGAGHPAGTVGCMSVSLKNHACFVSFLVVKKKGTAGLKLSNLMNLGRKKSSSLDSPERSLETSSK